VPIECVEKFESRQVTTGQNPSVELRYVIRGTNSDVEARSALLAGSPATIHNELASITAVANDHNGGPYAIVAALPTGESVAFDLTNLRFMFSVVLPYVIWYPRR